MSRTINVRCPNDYCGRLNQFVESDLVGEVPLVDDSGHRVPPPPVTIDENTFVQCEYCDYPISCSNATISD